MSAWSPGASLGASSLPFAVQALVEVLWLGSAVAAIQHVFLLCGEHKEAPAAVS
jgi:hypothetical protein